MKNLLKKKLVKVLSQRIIITIIVMTILSVTAIVFTTNIINQATKSKFYEEMTQLKEQKELAKVMTKLDETTGKITETAFYSRNITAEELDKLDETLKAEIIYVRMSFGDGERLKTSKIWKDNKYNCQVMFEEPSLSGLAEDIRYVSSNISSLGEDTMYLCDDTSNVCFKVQPTKIGEYTVHSLEYAKLVVDGVNARGVGTVDFDAGIITATDGTKSYEPDLNNFSYSTEVVYYSEDFSDTRTMTIQKFIEAGKPSTITDNGKKYTFANYSADSSRVWANIRTTSNGLVSYWVWIPRYAYKLNQDTQKSEITFVKLVDGQDVQMDGTELGDFKLHDAFTQKDGLKGIWIAKYAPSGVETVPIDNAEPQTPDLSNFDKATLKLVYYTEDGANSIEVDYTENPERTIEQDGKTYYWYNYTTKVWANIKTTANGLNAYWVWIPRYAYKLESGTSSVILVDENDKPIDTTKYGESLPSAYKLHDAFTQKDGLKGIWIAKYPPTAVETVPIDKTEPPAPDIADFKKKNAAGESIFKLVYYTEDGVNSIEVDYTENPEIEIERDGKTYYWYNYKTKVWANIKTMANGLTAYWVWIPRFAYKLESGTASVILVDKDNKPIDTTKYGTSLPEGFKLHDAFTQEKEDGKPLMGLWFAKYPPSGVPD